MNAWIETSDGRRIAVESNCHFGRLSSNTVRHSSPGASRRHAHIHAQQADNHVEYWLADLGSTNGTILNGKRVTIPCRLKNGDGIRIADEEFVFGVEFNAFGPSNETEIPPTMPVRANQRCWFLMVDIKRYTSLATQLDTDVLAQKVGTWLRQCRDIIESANGVVDKFLGDAIFAYWQDGDSTPVIVANVLRQLTALQQSRDPDFRLVLHHGAATISGGAGGADNLSGSEVIWVFRMEKVCSKLGDDSIVSAAAMAALPADCPCEPVGSHPLDGFPGTHAMFKLAGRVTGP
jgi:pSer/pThr/pTyr-binding forkhead associated (FHA) protein